ncbi:hypothetical protein GMSM_27610 [Geomonas sp. Red276]
MKGELMRQAKGIVFLVLGCWLAAAPVAADTMVITYRSGKVQKVVLDDSSAEVTSIAYQGESPPAAAPNRQPAPAQGVSPLPAGDSGAKRAPGKEKPAFTIRWAPPRE